MNDSDVVHQERRLGVPGRLKRTYDDINSMRFVSDDKTRVEIARRVGRRLRRMELLIGDQEDANLIREMVAAKVDPQVSDELSILLIADSLQARLGSGRDR